MNAFITTRRRLGTMAAIGQRPIAPRRRPARVAQPEREVEDIVDAAALLQAGYSDEQVMAWCFLSDDELKAAKAWRRTSCLAGGIVSPEEIRRRAEAISEVWSDEERASRLAKVPPMPPPLPPEAVEPKRSERLYPLSSLHRYRSRKYRRQQRAAVARIATLPPMAAAVEQPTPPPPPKPKQPNPADREVILSEKMVDAIRAQIGAARVLVIAGMAPEAKWTATAAVNQTLVILWRLTKGNARANPKPEAVPLKLRNRELITKVEFKALTNLHSKKVTAEDAVEVARHLLGKITTVDPAPVYEKTGPETAISDPASGIPSELFDSGHRKSMVDTTATMARDAG